MVYDPICRGCGKERPALFVGGDSSGGGAEASIPGLRFRVRGLGGFSLGFGV